MKWNFGSLILSVLQVLQIIYLSSSISYFFQYIFYKKKNFFKAAAKARKETYVCASESANSDKEKDVRAAEGTSWAHLSRVSANVRFWRLKR